MSLKALSKALIDSYFDSETVMTVDSILTLALFSRLGPTRISRRHTPLALSTAVDLSDEERIAMLDAFEQHIKPQLNQQELSAPSLNTFANYLIDVSPTLKALSKTAHAMTEW